MPPITRRHHDRRQDAAAVALGRGECTRAGCAPYLGAWVRVPAREHQLPMVSTSASARGMASTISPLYITADAVADLQNSSSSDEISSTTLPPSASLRAALARRNGAVFRSRPLVGLLQTISSGIYRQLARQHQLLDVAAGEQGDRRLGARRLDVERAISASCSPPIALPVEPETVREGGAARSTSRATISATLGGRPPPSPRRSSVT